MSLNVIATADLVAAFDRAISTASLADCEGLRMKLTTASLPDYEAVRVLAKIEARERHLRAKVSDEDILRGLQAAVACLSEAANRNRAIAHSATEAAKEAEKAMEQTQAIVRALAAKMCHGS